MNAPQLTVFRFSSSYSGYTAMQELITVECLSVGRIGEAGYPETENRVREPLLARRGRACGRSRADRARGVGGGLTCPPALRAVSIAARQRSSPHPCERRHARAIQRQSVFAESVVVDPAEHVEEVAVLLELGARHPRGADVGAEADAVAGQELVHAEESVARRI